MIALAALLALAAGAGAPGTHADGASPAARPNVVLVVMDALRADHLSLYGSARRTSPNIEALAKQAVVFDRAYAQAPWTPASMACLFTGAHQTVHQLIDSAEDATSLSVLGGDFVTMAEMFKAAGYRTGAVSSQPWISPRTGFDQGFDSFQVVASVADPFETDKTLLGGLEWIGVARREPFFLYMHFLNPHDPYDPPPPFDALWWRSSAVPPRLSAGEVTVRRLKELTRSGSNLDATELDYVKALYDSEISYVDFWIGVLMRELDKRGLRDSTVVVLTADHGEAFHEHGRYGHIDLYNEVLHVPLVFANRQLFPTGRRVSDPVQSIDVVSTLAGLIGSPPPAQAQGRDLLRSPAAESVYSEGFKLDSYKLQTDRWSLIVDEWFAKPRLFDLSADPGEATNVAAEHPEIRARLLEALIAQHRRDLEHPARGRPKQRTKADPETLERLRSLGYVQ